MEDKLTAIGLCLMLVLMMGTASAERAIYEDAGKITNVTVYANALNRTLSYTISNDGFITDLPKPSATTQIPTSLLITASYGTIIIENETVWTNETIRLTGNLIINSTGSLTLRNSTLIMNCIKDGEYHIEVKNKGSLSIYDSTITSASSNYEYCFWVNNGATFEMKNSALHECGYQYDPTWRHAGLWINTNNALIENNWMSNNGYGIIFYQSNNNTVANNTHILNTGSGITLYKCNNSIISNNTANFNSKCGILLWSSNNNTITNNNINSNFYDGIYLNSSCNNTISNNTASSNNDGSGIHIGSSSSNTISNNTNLNNYKGITLHESCHNKLFGNNANSNFWYGIGLVEKSRDNSITNNNVNSNDVYGIFLYNKSSNNTVTDNDATSNIEFGFYIHRSNNNTIAKNNALSNKEGIILVESHNNNVTENKANLNKKLGIELFFSSTGNQVINNDVSSNAYYGIVLLLSNNNNITSNNASNNNLCGIKLEHSSSNNSITDNNANSNYVGIILVSKSNNNTIINNNASSNFAEGIALFWSNNNKIARNNASNNEVGIVSGDSSDITITENSIVNNGFNKERGWGIYIESATNVSIYDNFITGTAGILCGWGIVAVNVSSMVVYNSTITRSPGDGIALLSSMDINIINSTITKNYNGVYCYYSSPIITNSTITESEEYDLYLNESSTVKCLNTTFTKSKVFFTDNDSILNVSWHLDVNVRDARYPVERADVIIYDSFSNDVFKGTTDTDGWIKDIEIQEYMQNKTAMLHYTPHTISAAKCGSSAYNESAITENKIVVVTLPPGVSTTFDTCSGTYPSIMGVHKGTIKPSRELNISRMYTYPCAGTGGHSEFVTIYGNGITTSGTWNGYLDDDHIITLSPPVTLLKDLEYNYTIRTGSYPQMHHTDALPTANGWINCTTFTDANGRTYTDWIPAIRLFTQ